MRGRLGKLALGMLGVVFALLLGALLLAPAAPVFEGVFWQPDCATRDRLSDYRRVGARTLVVQWTAVEGQYFDGTGSDPCLLDWGAVQAASGGLDLVLGLKGQFHPTPAGLPQLARASGALARYFPLPVKGYYAPVELQPEWPAAEVRGYLNALPRPLWVSAYAGPGRYTPAFTRWLTQALPDDARLLLQDGVGVGNATPEEAALVARNLRAHLGAERVAVVTEVFRRTPSPSKFRSALPWELDRQFRAYRGLPLIAFDGGHYMSRPWVRAFLAYRWLRGTP